MHPGVQVATPDVVVHEDELVLHLRREVIVWTFGTFRSKQLEGVVEDVLSG